MRLVHMTPRILTVADWTSVYQVDLATAISAVTVWCCVLSNIISWNVGGADAPGLPALSVAVYAGFQPLVNQATLKLNGSSLRRRSQGFTSLLPFGCLISNVTRHPSLQFSSITSSSLSFGHLGVAKSAFTSLHALLHDHVCETHHASLAQNN